MSYVVYRHLPGIPHRQYVRRIIHGTWVLWHRDPHIALRMGRRQAKDLADILWMRSTGWGGTQGATEPQGEYGTEVKP